MIKKLGRGLSRAVARRSRMKKINLLLDAGLPPPMRPVLEYLVTGKCDASTAAVVKHAEDRRREIARQGDKEVPIWYSPKPGSSGSDSGNDSRPQPGKVLKFTMEKIAATGKEQKWGTALYLLAKGFESAMGLELGSCAGISAIYLSSAPAVKKLITVEGSEALAEIARESLRSSGNVQVVNSLFDGAIDSELPELNSKIDLAYIDGHHEKVATIHYFNRLLPFLEAGAVVIFDDISWSNDMHEAWTVLSRRLEFSHAMDMGAIGVCILKTEKEDSQAEPEYWNLEPVVGKYSIGDPQGWKE